MALVVAVSAAPKHGFSKANQLSIRLLAGLGVDGDAHQGTTVRHRHDARKDPARPNLRQVHLMAAELLDELSAGGFALTPGALGENLTTRGLDLGALATGTRLSLGAAAVLKVTGLRAPCVQIDRFRPGLMRAMGRRAGIMAIVLRGGDVRPGDAIGVEHPPPPHRPLVPV